MPLAPRIRPGRRSAGKQFTDRLAFIEAFDLVLERLDPEDASAYLVLVYYGVGGIGKTALRRHLGQRLDTLANTCWAVVDFEAPPNREAENALFVMRNELKRKYRFRFPLFDLAYALYWERTHPQTPLARADLPGLEEGDLLLDVLLAVEDVPGLGLLTKIPKAIASLGGKALDWWRGREDDMRTFAGLEPQQMLEHLSMFWALDLQRARATTGEKVVLFLDTYEALWQGKRVEHLRFSVDQWVRDWVLQLPQVLWVISGREKLAWTVLDPDWDEALDQHLIGALAPEDARRFLRTAGVADPEIQDVIIESAQGVPFYLDLAVDTYLQITITGQTPAAQDFAHTPREVLDRFLRYLDRSERETLNVLSATRSWNQTLFEQVITTFQTGYPPTALRDLCRFSFIEDVPAENADAAPAWKMNTSMREGLQTHADPDLLARVHLFLHEYYNAGLQHLDPGALTNVQQQAFTEAFYHGQAALEPEEFTAWYNHTEYVFWQAAQWQLLIPLQEQMTAFVSQHGDAEALALSLSDLAGLYVNQGRYAEAEPLSLRALSTLEQILGTDHADLVNTLNGLALLYDEQGRYAEAEPLSLRALSILEQTLETDPLDFRLTRSLNNLAALYDGQGRYAEAESLHKRALSILEQAPDTSTNHVDVATALSLNNLAVLYLNQGRYDEAEPLCKRALSIREQAFGPGHPDVANALNTLAGLYDCQGRYEEAESLHERALSIREQTLGTDHPDVANSLNNLAALYDEQGRYEEAESLHERALSIREQILGPRHPDVANSLNNLAALYLNQGRYEEAEPLYLRALSIREQVLGSWHPDLVHSLNNLAALYDKQGRYGEAVPLYQRVLSILEQTLGSDHPDLADPLNNLGGLYVDLGRYEEAEPLLLRATVTHATLPDPHYWLARLYQSRAQTGDLEPEASAWRRYLALGPTSEERKKEAQNRLSFLLR